MTHFDYGLRRFTFTAEEFAEHFEAQLLTIFKKVVERELGDGVKCQELLEIRQRDLYRYAVPLYQRSAESSLP